jgi:hypothetical protein
MPARAEQVFCIALSALNYANFDATMLLGSEHVLVV